MSHQSFEITRADISIQLNGHLIFNRTCRVEDQHNWYRLDESLGTGASLLEVKELKTGTTKEVEFDLTEETWMATDFWCYPDRHPRPHFTVDSYDHPIAFS